MDLLPVIDLDLFLSKDQSSPDVVRECEKVTQLSLSSLNPLNLACRPPML